MRRPIARASVPITLIVSVAITWLFGGCGGRDVTVGIANEAGAPIFAAPDASAEDASANDTLLTYCPSSKCPEGWTTCPSSRFPCDVNLLRDIDNCGACGSVCPRNFPQDYFACSNGVCVPECGAISTTSAWQDCDGIPDNGCETSVTANNKHCGACGNVCSDPTMPCVRRGDNTWACGCAPDEQLCETQSGTTCVERDDDNHCGACGNKCDPNNDGGTPPPNAAYGCNNGQCGALKCKSGYSDCDNVLDNGCETPVDTDENCGTCGNACPNGQSCRVDLDRIARCMCPPGKTFCAVGTVGNLEAGECVDLATSDTNCGACGVRCPRCKFGTCVEECDEGLADCNNSASDGCEVDTNRDPRNCGGCGFHCDAEAGQACVAGRCVVEPCSADAGGGSAR